MVAVNMDILVLYAIVVGSLLGLLLVLQALSFISPWTTALARVVARHFSYPYFLRRHRLFGPWTRAGLILHILYVSLNILLFLFRTTSVAAAGNRAGTLALINLIFLVSTPHLSFLSDLLGISLRLCHRIHRAMGWTVAALLLFHVCTVLFSKRATFSLQQANDLFTLIVSFLPLGGV
jgi:hypothetical protein